MVKKIKSEFFSLNKIDEKFVVLLNKKVIEMEDQIILFTYYKHMLV